MISLDVADYCHTCDGFEPKVVRTEMGQIIGENWVETVVRCEHSKKCLNMYRHITKEVLKEK